jgi:hypothetical protein
LKIVLGMDVLRRKTPEMVRKELWLHLLVYNLVRELLAQAAPARCGAAQYAPAPAAQGRWPWPTRKAIKRATASRHEWSG